MIQSELIIVKVATGETVNIYSSYTGDTEYSYAFNTLIVEGSNNGVTSLIVNGMPMELCGGFVLNQISIRSVEVLSAINTNDSTPGVILFGQKTRHNLFTF